MYDDKVKEKLIKELEKSGNILMSCLKLKIHRSTYHRWVKSDKKFKKEASQAIKHGRENNCDIAKHALMLKIKDKDLGAIKYLLSHTDPMFKPKKQTSNVVILHKKDYPVPQQEKSLEDWIDEDEKKLNEQEPKDRGTEIIIDEKIREARLVTHTAGSKSCSDKPVAKPQENHKTSNTSHSETSNHHIPQDSNT